MDGNGDEFESGMRWDDTVGAGHVVYSWRSDAVKSAR
jgi:hypothetical protein